MILNDLMDAKMRFNAGQYSTAKAIAEAILSTEMVNASNVLWKALLTVQNIAEEGYNVTLAQALLTEAETLLKAEQYSNAITLANYAVTRAQQSKESSISISPAEEAIRRAENENGTDGLDQARQLLEQAKTFAEQAIVTANNAKIPEFGIVVIIAAICVIGIFYYLGKKQHKPKNHLKRLH